jgi:DNA (cytosine-5)-methyltransferase 1
MLVLSLFPGIGLLDKAFEEEGFCVVRGPDVIWGGDIRRFTPPSGVFDGIIGGPPCQSFSSLAHLVRANGHEPKFGNLIPEFERCVLQAKPRWFLMENVPKAPVPLEREDGTMLGSYAVHSFLLDNSRLAGADGWGQEQIRVRRFTFGIIGQPATNLMRWIDLATFVLPDADRTVTALGPDHLAGPVTTTHDSLENLSAWSKTRKVAVTSTDGGVRPGEKTRVNAVSSSGNGRGKERPQQNEFQTKQGRYRLADALRLQGLPEDFLDHCPFTAEGKLKAVANGVPLSMGRAIAGAIKEAIK